MPEMLVTNRVSIKKKKGPYRNQLIAIIDRWRAIQLIGLSLGTMGFGLLAVMTWNVPLGSLSLQIATWITAGLLLSSLTLFSAKLAWVLGIRPLNSLAPSVVPEETFHQPLKRAVGEIHRF
ncbi:MAG: hypothetical protein CAF45_003320 [Nitrospira sp. CG24E]|nr:MAG: hypothetical protein CAF45_003320 [Nitrospira sp. CG24E]